MRSFDLARPLTGAFATKNATYAMIARNWATGRSPWRLPTTDCVAGGDRGWHLVELPVAAYIAGAGWRYVGGSLDVWGRATAVAWSIGSIAALILACEAMARNGRRLGRRDGIRAITGRDHPGAKFHARSFAGMPYVEHAGRLRSLAGAA